MADEVGHGNQRGRGAPRRPRGHRGGRGQPWGQGRFQGRRQGQIEDNGAEEEVAEPVVAPPREQGPRRRVHIGLAALDRMLQLSPEELLLQITNRASGFPDALEDAQLLSKPDCMSKVLAVIASAMQSQTNKTSVTHLLNIVRTSALMSQHMSAFFTRMPAERSMPRQRTFRRAIKDFLLLYRQLLTQFNEGVMPLGHLLIILQYVINDLRTNTNIVDDEIDSALADVNQRADELAEQGRARQQELQNAGADHGVPRRGRRQVQPPPNDFRDISIFPDINTDIHTTEKPFLRENIIKGEFEDGEHYLDVQFRLLREDFIRPLRNGIHEYMNLREDGEDLRRRRRKLTDVRIYHDVAILNPVCTPVGIQHRIRFDVSRMGHVKWRYSKRLIYGSLLCLSSDDFATIRIASVAQRDPEHLQDGELIIQFETNIDEIRLLPPTERFLMVETSSYFEAYRHVLLALQNSREQDIPFLDNVVLCNREVEPPQYLRTAEEPTYDLRAIAGRKVNLFRNHDLDDDNDDYTEEDIDPDDMPVAVVPILQRGSWPSAETLHVDDSQLRAIQTALTKRIAIIQGPPGTGKTYIGLKVVQVLLENSQIWNTAVPEENSPILVVCYTNHALDQFLEGLCRFVRNGMVRVGGRSKSKKLEQFLLRELRKRSRESRSVPRAIFLNRVEARGEMELQQVEIERQTAIIESTERGLVHEDVLRSRIMFEGHYEDLTSIVGLEDNGGQANLFASTSKYGKSFLPLWLGLEDIIYSEEQPDNNNPDQANVEQGQHAEQAPDHAEDPGEEEEDDIAARAEEGERIIEDEDDEAALRRLEEQRRRRQNERRAEEQLAVNFDNVLEAAAEAAAQGQWKTQKGTRKKKRQLLRRGLQKNDQMTIAQVNAVTNVWALPPNDRWRLYRYWLSLYQAQLKVNITEAEGNFQMAANRMKELLEVEDMAIMTKMKIIGMTTTGAARYKNVLRRIQPKIVIVEEAAEVLEAHVVTTLSAQCQHLILIGDHQQLRPSPNVYDLAENYNLKYSLFERLVINELEHETLERQHRMRPEIANVLRIIYPGLVDDQSVQTYENVKGVSSSLYFISHNSEEHRDDELKSMSNEHEATYLVALCNYLVLQGYAPSRITILTPYTGQVFLVRRMLRQRPTLQDVRLCPVDNYQGEENDIVLLSVVRSRSSSELKPSIGFVKDENRICVALSRAKIGLFVVGNFQHLARNSELWSKIVQKAKEMGVMGDSLRLVCQNHPEQAQIEARKARDFNKAPEGGCMRECGYRLHCGHACERVCHSYDRDHVEYKCRKTCMKILCANGHHCTKPCHETCGRCMEPKDTRLPRCGHVQPVPCSVAMFDFKCKANCDHRLACGHPCQNKCGEDHTRECNYGVMRKCPIGHESMIKCHQRNDEDIPCKEACHLQLECLHPCSGSCGLCFSGRLHAACQKDCGRTLVCGHQCTEPCTNQCPPCGRPCQNRCNHSRCPKACGHPCDPCREPCLWSCQHYQCTRLCHEPCDRPRCDQPCTRLLPCRHQCIGICGETCPTKCRVCDQGEVTEVFFGTEEEPDARFVQLEDCNHIFEVSGLDHWMEMAVDETQDQTIQLKQCPRCRVTIRRNLRYGTIINQLLADVEQVKRRVVGEVAEYGPRSRRLLRQIKELRLPEETESFYSSRLKSAGLSSTELACVENVVNFLEHVTKWEKEVQEKARSVDRETRGNLHRLQDEMKKIRQWLAVPRTRLSEQQVRECSMEITRFDLLSIYHQIRGKIKTQECPLLTNEKKQRFVVMLRQLSCGSPLNPDNEKSAREILQETQKCMSGLEISEQERVMIVTAMELGQGHWFKCPNGHIYAIGECGGANQVATCPECKATIGGTGHQLTTGNEFAPEMDRAQAPAWPGMANAMNI